MVETTAGFDFAELPHLATFAAVAERGSFTATAAQLGVTQAAVSQRIAVLEKELHVSLFNRRARRISLSDAGQRLYQYARQILELHGQARTDIGAFRPIVAGDLPVAASSVPGECFLPALLSAFHEKHPRVKGGLGIAIVSRLAIQREIDTDELRAVTVSGLSLTRHFYLVYHRRRPLSAAASVFMHFLRSRPIGAEMP
jgi:DNA-binding transcriptional LysR family regulator